jgi:hypothetical protein
MAAAATVVDTEAEDTAVVTWPHMPVAVMAISVVDDDMLADTALEAAMVEVTAVIMGMDAMATMAITAAATIRERPLLAA